MLIAGVWAVPFMGAFVAAMHVPRVAFERAPPRVGGPVAPQALAADGVAGFNVTEHLNDAGGIPLLDWAALSAWADRCRTADERTRAIDAGRVAWLLHLRDALGPHAHLHVSADACILSTLASKEIAALAQYVTTARARVSRVLGSLARLPVTERSIVLVFDSEDDYYAYVSLFYPPDGEFAFSGGMFIDAGCPHFVVVRGDLAGIEPVIAHELTHSAVSHLRLPKWLDEGLAVNTEHKVAGARRLLYTPHELHALHVAFWNAERIQEFWSGASFARTDHGNLLSYELARVIVEQMARDWDAFAAFVAAAAQAGDGGAEAAQRHLSVRLGAYAAALVEADADLSWDPDASAWAVPAQAPAPAVEVSPPDLTRGLSSHTL